MTPSPLSGDAKSQSYVYLLQSQNFQKRAALCSPVLAAQKEGMG